MNARDPGGGRRREDRELAQLAEDRKKLVEEHLELTRRRARHAREQTWLVRLLVVVVFALAAVVSYGITVTLPAVRRAQDQQVCAYRAVANREAALARVDAPPAARRRHGQNAETFRALERVASEGRRVHCRRLINAGRR